MSIVKFPGFNLEFEFSKIAFSIFGIDIYKYAICIVLGIVVAMFLCFIDKEKYDNDYNFVLECVIVAIFFGIIGARLYFVIFNLEYYSQNIIQIFNFRNGGLAIYGGLLFGAISIIVFCKISKKDILNFLDYIIPFVAIAQCIGRFGNFFNVEAYGYETTSIFRMGIHTLDGYKEVHPTFLYESICTFIIFLILNKIQKKRKFKGQILLLYFICYSTIRFFIEGLRTDSLMFYNLRISKVISLIVFGVSFMTYYIKICKIKNEK